jgi:hypothetical protein
VGLGSGQYFVHTVAQAEKVSPVNSQACALSARLVGPFLFVRKRICRVHRIRDPQTPAEGKQIQRSFFLHSDSTSAWCNHIVYGTGSYNRSAGTHHPTPLRLLGEGHQYEIFFPNPASYIPKPPNMPPKADSIEIAMQNASAAMDADPTLKGTDVAKQYNAIYQRLMAQRRGRSSSSSRGGHNQKLEDPQNHAVQDYLTMLYHASTSANLKALVLAANRVLFYLGSSGTVSQ